MSKLILEVEKGKARMLVEFLRSLSYVRMASVPKEEEYSSLLASELKEAVEELKAVREGKKESHSLEEFLDGI